MKRTELALLQKVQIGMAESVEYPLTDGGVVCLAFSL